MRGPLVPTLVIGGARSGTTFVSRLCALLLKVPLLVEPHAAWKVGHFHRLSDDWYDEPERTVRHVRRLFYEEALGHGNGAFVEKSPPNILRPRLVWRAFPEARVIYCAREFGAARASLERRRERGDSMRIGGILQKYARPQTGGGEFNELYLPFWRQIPLADLAAAVRYARAARRLKGERLWPFGPRFHGFEQVIRDGGIGAFYEELGKRIDRGEREFRELYGSMFVETSVDEFARSPSGALEKMADALNVRVNGDAQSYAYRVSVGKRSRERIASVMP